MNGRLLKPDDVMRILGCKADKARDVMRRMPHVDLSGTGRRAVLRVWEADLIDWLNEQSQEAPRPKRVPKQQRKRNLEGPKLIPHRKEAI